MQPYFFDSSALVKRYVNEIGTAWIINLFGSRARHQIFVVEITLAEVISALARRHRGLSVSSRAYGGRATMRFHKAFDTKFFKVKVHLPMIRHAALLAEKCFLRGYDAVQLAAAMEVEAERRLVGASPLTLVTADTDLLSAANSEGLLVENPNSHP